MGCIEEDTSMRRTLGWCAAVLLLALAAPAFAAGVKTSEVTFKSGDDTVKGFLAEPEGRGPFPAVVVIQEWWGLNDWIKDNAKRLAGQGYVALAPDLYRGKVTDDPMEAMKLVRGLPPDRAVRDLKAAVDTLSAKGNVDRTRLGSIGWCMGGGYSLQLALKDPRVKACVICYGRVVTKADEVKPLEAAVLGIFGEEDRGIPPATVHQFEAALKEAGKKTEAIKEFKAGHGFMRPGDGPDRKNPAYREEAAKQAWQDIDRFFAKTLQRKRRTRNARRFRRASTRRPVRGVGPARLHRPAGPDAGARARPGRRNRRFPVGRRARGRLLVPPGRIRPVSGARDDPRRFRPDGRRQGAGEAPGRPRLCGAGGRSVPGRGHP
jgi:carboxymethylenebutenolidase